MLRAPTIWLSPIKVNIHLHILGRRLDGYHDIQSHVIMLDVGDTLHITANNNAKIQVIIYGSNTIDNENNSVYHTATLFQAATNTVKGAHIHLHKKVPIGSGLGGGSSNAATILLALNLLWDCKWSTKELMKLGTTIGSDVNLFLARYPSALITSRGEKVERLASPKEKYYAFIVPHTICVTELMYKDPYLCRNSTALPLSEIQQNMGHNDFTNLAIELYPEVQNCLNYLSQFGDAKMSGSGSACFVACDSKEEAQEIINQYPYTSRWKAIGQPLSFKGKHQTLSK